MYTSSNSNVLFCLDLLRIFVIIISSDCVVFVAQLSLLLKGTVVAPPDKFGKPSRCFQTIMKMS